MKIIVIDDIVRTLIVLKRQSSIDRAMTSNRIRVVATTIKDVNGWTSSAMTRDGCALNRHARLYAGHPRLHRLATAKDVDGRDKPGHDKDALSLHRHAHAWRIIGRPQPCESVRRGPRSTPSRHHQAAEIPAASGRGLPPPASR